MFPEGAERENVELSSCRSPEVLEAASADGDQSDVHTTSAQDSAQTKSALLASGGSTSKPCIVRYLNTVSVVASAFLRATHQHPGQDGLRTPIIDPSAVQVLQILMLYRTEFEDLLAALQRTDNLKKLIVSGMCLASNCHEAAYEDVTELLGDVNMKGLFWKPRSRCLGTLEEIDLEFRWDNRPSSNPTQNILQEFSTYPADSVLKRVILRMPYFVFKFCPPSKEGLRNGSLALAELFNQRSRFPSIESVELIPEVNGMTEATVWSDAEVAVLRELFWKRL